MRNRFTWDDEGQTIDERPANVVDFNTLYRREYDNYQAVLDEASEIADASRSRDFYCSSSNIRITPEGVWSILAPNKQELFFVPTSAALASFCTLLYPVYDNSAPWSAQTVATLLNHDPVNMGKILEKAFAKSGATYLFRTYRQNIKAIRSQYCVVDNLHVLEYMEGKLERMGLGVDDVQIGAISPEKMRLPIAFKETYPEGKGNGPYKSGVGLYNDETGLGGIGVKSWVQRGVCLNSMTFRCGSSVSHSGANDMETRVKKIVKVGAMVSAAAENNEQILELIPSTRGVEVPNLAEVYAGAGAQYGWGHKLEEFAVAHSEWDGKREPTVFDVVQGLTYAAHSYVPKNDSQISSAMAWDLEDLAGNLLRQSSWEFERLADVGREVIEKREMQEVER